MKKEYVQLSLFEQEEGRFSPPLVPYKTTVSSVNGGSVADDQKLNQGVMDNSLASKYLHPSRQKDKNLFGN